jgi:Domain of unknown function (DUF3471)
MVPDSGARCVIMKSTRADNSVRSLSNFVSTRILAKVGMSGSRRDTSSRPSLPLAKYAGLCRDAWYGDIRITETGGRLSVQFTHTPLPAGDLEHWQHDTFVARWTDRALRADAFITFALTPDGSIDQARMRAVSPATDFSFDFQDLLLKPVR